MIIIIILLSILIISTTTTIILRIRGFWFDECPNMVIGIIAIVSLIFCICVGIPCLCINSDSNYRTTKYWLIEKINLYSNEKQILESYHLVNENDKTMFTSDITLEVISTSQYYQMVRDYNKTIFDFKCDVKGAQYRRKNPWISWFNCPAYLSITDEMLNSLEYTTGK